MRVLVARPDSNGDVLLAEPAIRAVAASADIDLLVSGQGLLAAELIPNVNRLLVHQLPWIDANPEPVSNRALDLLIDDVKAGGYDKAIILTSFHQSALPLAFALKLAGVPWIAARSEDYPGSLLDLRFQGDEEVHEVERSLLLVEAAGFSRPAELHIQLKELEPYSLPDGGYVVVHPGGTSDARRWDPQKWRALVQLFSDRYCVVVTGSADESDLTRFVAGEVGIDLGGKTTFSQLASVIAGAECLVSGNTSAVHLASAVQTPVALLFSPVVPINRWKPWQIPFQLLGDQNAPCRDTRVRSCLVPGHPCLNTVTPAEAFESTLYLIGEL